VTNDITRKLESLVPELTEALGQASSLEELEELRVRFLGRKGLLADLMSGLTALSPEDRPAVGKAANQVKAAMTDLWEGRLAALKAREQERALGAFDASVPSWQPDLGSLHPVTRITREICTVFTNLGFEVVSGPEVENDFNNFEALNLPPEHPARDMQDTLYISESILLRTHTSPLQVRTMLARKPPLGVIAPGKVYRRDSDITHTPMFHQVEGLLVDTHVTMADLRGILTAFVQTVFGHDTRVRFRPSFFPFTEPSAQRRGGHQLRHLRRQGPRERRALPRVQGDGLGRDPRLRHGRSGRVPEGVERIAMLKYGIGDLRMFFENDLRFLRQFA